MATLGAGLAAALALPCAARAQAPASTTATHAPIALLVPTGTRALAMGDAGVAMTEPDAVFYNPAQLAAARGVTVGGQRWGVGATLASVAAAIPMAPGGLGLGVQYLDHGAPCRACGAVVPPHEGALAARGALPASALVASLAFGRELSGVRVGVAAKWIEQHAPDARDGATAVDVGVARRAGPVWLGVAAQNVGGGLRLRGGEPDAHWELPRRATVGAAADFIPIGPLDLAAAATVSFLDGGDVTAGGGVELGYSPLEGYTVAGRVGLRHLPDDGVAPLSLGAILSRDRLALEYAFQPLDGPGALHRVGVRLRP